MKKQLLAIGLGTLLAAGAVGFTISETPPTEVAATNIEQTETPPATLSIKDAFFTTLQAEGVTGIIENFSVENIEAAYNQMSDEEWMDYANSLTTDEWVQIDTYMYGEQP